MNQLARLFVLVGLVRGFGASSSCADGIIQVAPDPCIAGEATTVCVTLCDCGSEVTSGSLNGTEVGVTTIDDNTVLLSIPSGAVQTGSNTLTLTKPDGTVGGIIGGIPPIGTPGGLADFFAVAAHQITSLTIQRIEQKVQQGLALLIPDRPRHELAVGIETKKREMRQARHAGERTLRDLERTIDRLLQGLLRQHPGRETARAVRLAREQIRDTARTNRELIDDTERSERDYLEDQKGWMFKVSDIKNPKDAEEELKKKYEEELERDKDKNGGANGPALGQAHQQGFDTIYNPPPTGPWTALQLQKIVTTAGTVMAGIVTPCACTFTLEVEEGRGPDPAQPYSAAGTTVPWIMVVPARLGEAKIRITIRCTGAAATGDDVDVHAESVQFQPPSTTGGGAGPFQDGPDVPDSFDGQMTITFGNAAPGTLIHVRITMEHGDDECTQDVLILITE